MKLRNLKSILWVSSMLASMLSVPAQTSKFTKTQEITIEQCGTDELHKELMKDPKYFGSFMECNKELENKRITNTQKTIPVIVHILHSGQPYGEFPNLLESDVLDIIEVTNQKFEDNDSNIEICVAAATTTGESLEGIQYHDMNDIFPGWQSLSVLNYYFSVINAISYDRDNYLNIYIWQWSGNPTGFSWLPPTNYGAWVKASAFIDQDSDTFIHELGHYFGLAHTFSKNLYGNNYISCEDAASESSCNTQGDRVCDTPPTPINWSCINPTCPDLNPHVENFMDYTPDNCADSFTIGQINRMHSQLELNRPELIGNEACGGCETLDCPWDLNGDGMVNVKDLTEMLTVVGMQGECLDADFDGNGIVGTYDIIQFIQHFGYDCESGNLVNDSFLMLKVLDNLEKNILINYQILDISGRKVNDKARLMPGIYIVVYEWKGGVFTTNKIYLSH